MNDPELPPVHAENVDAKRVDQLFRDIALASRVLEIRIRGGPQSRASQLDTDLDAARQAFVEGRVHGLQIRYLFQGSVCCDTLMRLEHGSRLVRIRE